MGFDTLRQLLKHQTGQRQNAGPQKPVLLIIDDDRHLLEDLAFALKDDYQVWCCQGGQEGLERLDENVSAVVLDIKMPGQDGFEIIKAVKERFSHLPVLFHSAYQDLKNPFEIMNEYRPFGYVSKSADLSQLRDSIASAVAYYTQIRKNQILVKELQLTKNFLDNIINSMPSVLVGLDPDRHVIHWNRKAEELTGISAENAVGRQVETVFPQIVEQLGKVSRAIAEKAPQKEANLVKQENGNTRYSDMLFYPLVSNGIEGVVLRIDDVTERVMLKEMMVKAEKMMTVSGLAAGIAHEINNPLSIILQSIQLARHRFSPELDANNQIAQKHGIDLDKMKIYLEERKIFKHFDNIENASMRTSEIVQNMLNFSRKCESNHTLVDMHQLIEEIIHLATNEYTRKSKLSFKSITIIRQYAADFPRIPCIRVEIGQVLLNLLRNAAQAMEGMPRTHKPQIIIHTWTENQTAVIAVTDNGQGMDPKTINHVFEPFFTTKSEGQGTGLGLSVSYHIIVEHHQGALSVASEPATGATFKIELPLSSQKTQGAD